MITNAFTLRLVPAVAKKLSRYCDRHGYSKTGLLQRLIEEYLDKFEAEDRPPPVLSPKFRSASFKNIVGIVSLGGDAVLDADSAYHD